LSINKIKCDILSDQ